MYDQIRQDVIFIMLYAVVTVLALLGSCYLLFRRDNAFAPDVTPPLQLRRWAAAFLAIIALNHLWYMPILFLSTEADILLCDLLGGLLDSITFFPLSVVIMLMMLQDRRRLLWPIFVAFVPIVLASAWSVVTRSYDISPVVYSYFLLLVIVLIIYMVREVRRYGRWLRDNYADLEHKEVWQSFLVMAVIMLAYVSYALSDEGTGLYLQHDLTLSHLAQALGTNRTYLGMYFSRQGTTYNTYINDLRIDCFVRLVREANAAHRPFTAQELAVQSGYRSYSTFSHAFK